MLNKTRIVAVSILLVIVMGIPASAKGREFRFEAELLGSAGDVSGGVKYTHRVDRNRRQFSLEVEGFQPGGMYDVMIAGVIVGKVGIGDFGFGELSFDDNFEPGLDDPSTRFPANFPALDGGELVVIGPLSGTLQVK